MIIPFRMRLLTVATLAAMSQPLLALESIAGIVTDYAGFFESYDSALSVVRPDSSHDLLGFQQNGTIYSTGDSDGIPDCLDTDTDPGADGWIVDDELGISPPV